MSQLSSSAKHSAMIGVDLESELSAFNASEIPNGRSARGKSSRYRELDSFPSSTSSDISRTSTLRSLLVLTALVSTLVFLFVCLVVPLFNAVNHPIGTLKTMDKSAGGHDHSFNMGCSPPSDGDMSAKSHEYTDEDMDMQSGKQSDKSKESSSKQHSHMNHTRDDIKNSSSLESKNNNGESSNPNNQDLDSRRTENKKSTEDETQGGNSTNEEVGQVSDTDTVVKTEEEIKTIHDYQRFVKLTAIACGCFIDDLDHLTDSLLPISQKQLTCMYRCINNCNLSLCMWSTTRSITHSSSSSKMSSSSSSSSSSTPLS